MKSYKKTIVHMIEYTETIKKTIDFYNKHHKEHICQECGKPLDFKCINYKCDLSPEVSSKKELTTDDPCSWRHVPGEVCKNCGMES